MITEKTILKSKKRSGKYENIIIFELIDYFKKKGYAVIPHARFNIAWGSILSDIDILLIKNDILILIEVKSSRDNLLRAKKQISVIQDYVDFAYIATDYYPKKWPSTRAGHIVTKDGTVSILKEPTMLKRTPTLNSVMSLKKESLLKLLGNSSNAKKISKYELASLVKQREKDNLKNHVKQIVTCTTYQ